MVPSREANIFLVHSDAKSGLPELRKLIDQGLEDRGLGRVSLQAQSRFEAEKILNGRVLSNKHVNLSVLTADELSVPMYGVILALKERFPTRPVIAFATEPLRYSNKFILLKQENIGLLMTAIQQFADQKFTVK